MKPCLHCFVPPYMLKSLGLNTSDEMRGKALDALESSAELRTERTLLPPPVMMRAPGPQVKNRIVYSMSNQGDRMKLPGSLRRKEGDPPTRDARVDEAYDNCGIVYDFFKDAFSRNSIDNNGMTLVSSVHFDVGYNNAMWNGSQMIYGDGDMAVFQNFTASLDVVGHELTHGITSYSSRLAYNNESGALNEHFSDVLGVLAKQWKLKQSADKADWLIGAGVIVSGGALRTLKNEKAYVNNQYLGSDPQPKLMKNFVNTTDDRGGVHINSGIPNYAFYLVATKLGGYAWQKAGKIWYETFTKRLYDSSDFGDAATQTISTAQQLFGATSPEANAVKEAWQAVGVL